MKYDNVFVILFSLIILGLVVIEIKIFFMLFGGDL